MTTDTDHGERPQRVLLYAYITGRPQVAAEIRWSPEEGVTVTVLDAIEGTLAEHYAEQGVWVPGWAEPVRPDDGPAFLQALVNLSPGSYSRFVATPG